MRKGQLIKKVLKVYKEEIQYLQENFQGVHINIINAHIQSKNLHQGVCYFICRILPRKYYYSGYDSKWVHKYYSKSNVWGAYPNYGRNLQEVIDNLQIRVDIMERELQEGDKLHQRLDSKYYYISNQKPGCC